MRLFGYYAWHSFINQVRKMLKTWVLIFLLACMLIGGIIGGGAAKLSSVADTLHLLDGTTSGSVDAQFMLNDWQGDTLTVSGATDTPVHYIAMTYVLASTDKEMVNEVRLDVAGKQNGIDFAIDHEIANVPIQRNYRTNIIGDIFSIEGQFNIIIDPIYNTPDHDKSI